MFKYKRSLSKGYMGLIDDAKKGKITEEMKLVAENEGVEPEFIRRGIANGNDRRDCFRIK